MAVGKYDTHVKPKLLLIEAWARDGLTDEDIAKNLDISVASFHNYKKDHLEFFESLKRKKEEADIVVENSLYKRANGYEYEEITRELVVAKGPDGPIIYEDEHGNMRYREELQVTKVVTKQLAGDTTAQIFWLKNRKPKEWRDKQDIEHSGHMTNKIDLSGLSVEDLKAYAKTKQSAT